MRGHNAQVAGGRANLYARMFAQRAERVGVMD
jgi:hypothetical protein